MKCRVGCHLRFSRFSQLLNLTQYIEDGYEKSLTTSTVFVDLSAAYDTVNHRVLLTKLYGVTEDAEFTKPMESMMRNRRFYVALNGKKSGWRNPKFLINEMLEICALLLDQFNSVFTSPITNMIVHDPVSFFSCQSLNPNECLTDVEITEQIIIDSIQEHSSASAAGPDGVPSSLLLKCAAELATALKLMFSQSLTHSFIPSSLKRATITTVFKSGTKSSPSNYRPISLTSTIIKVFERIIRKQVVAFLTSQDHLHNTHHGFRSDRSCLSALLDVFDDLMHMLSSDTTVDMICLDFSKWIMAYTVVTQTQRCGYHR